MFFTGFRRHCGTSTKLTLLACMLCMASSNHLYSQDFSDWNQASGFKKVEYRWRPSGDEGCELEYRNRDERDHRKYKSRIVFQVNGDERVKNYAVVSFGDPPPYMDKVPACTQITDVSLTRF